MEINESNIKTVIPVVSTLIGVILGWLLNELRDHFRVRRDNRRIVNSVLFNLLEIRFFLSRTELDKFTKKVIDYLKQKFPNEIPKDIQSIINQIFNIFLQTIIAEKHSVAIKSIESKYNDSIKELSKIYPILAYKVGGKLSLYNYLEYLKDYTEKVNEILNMELIGNSKSKIGPMNFDKLKETLGSSLQPVLYNEAMDVVTNDIKKTSRKLGLRTSRACKKIMKTQDSSDITKELDKILDSHFKVMMAPLGN